jgi:hypothetical protein
MKVCRGRFPIENKPNLPVQGSSFTAITIGRSSIGDGRHKPCRLVVASMIRLDGGYTAFGITSHKRFQ